MHKENAVLVVVILLFLITSFVFFLPKEKEIQSDGKKIIFRSFSSAEEMRSYISTAHSAYGGYSLLVSPVGYAQSITQGIYTGENLRYSKTNVQVEGVDEADILKVDDEYAYYISQQYYDRGIKVIRAYPPEEAEMLSNISHDVYDYGSNGLYVDGNLLISIKYDGIKAFDISDRNDPQDLWKISLNGSYADSRKVGKYLYVVIRNWASSAECPVHVATISPASGVQQQISVDCSKIFYPETGKVSGLDSYTLLKINMEVQSVEKAVSFLAAYGIKIYMSKENLYAAHEIRKSEFEIIKEFIKEKGREVFPQQTLERINRLFSYDISDAAKMVELQMIFYSNYYSAMSGQTSSSESGEKESYERILKAMKAYRNDHRRELVKTVIMKIPLETFEVKGSSEIPGILLNQFSMDEYVNYFRVAVTVGGFDANLTENDVYVLDGDMNIVGSLTGIERGERIFAVRFIHDKGYIVTFRQTDPLFVIDLSDPTKPEIKGQLEIPGFSAYLHPIEGDRLIGVGREDSNIKVSLFDVSNPENPVELDKYILRDEYWSEALYEHHAILYDSENRLFVIPASKMLIFRIDDDMQLVKSVKTSFSPRRSAYIGNFLYLFSESQMDIYRMGDWEKIKEIYFGGKKEPAYPRARNTISD